jgi:hypothetical protein
VGGEILTFPDTLTTQGLSLWSLNIVGGEILTFPDTLTTQGLSLWSLNIASKSRPTATEPHAYELAAAVRARLGSDWAIGETGVAGPAPNARGIAPGVCAIAVVGPGKRRLTKSLWPDDQLNASDAYGQAPKLSREERMQQFSAEAINLLCDAIAVEHGELTESAVVHMCDVESHHEE